MAPRANWKGYLRLSLVSCPIALYPAFSLSEKVTTTAADPNVTLYQLQENCEKLAAETFNRETAYDEDRVDYRAHYNARLKKCLYAETYISPTPVALTCGFTCPTSKKIEFTAGFTGPPILAFFTATFRTSNAAQ